MRRLVAFSALVVGLSVSGISAAELTLGRWCNKPLPALPALNAVIAIEVMENGSTRAVTRFGDGSVNEQDLVEEPGSVFAVVDSPSGDRYRLVKSTGNLQIIDNDGILSEAARLENTPSEGECL